MKTKFFLEMFEYHCGPELEVRLATKNNMTKLTVFLCCLVAVLFYPISCVIVGIEIGLEATRSQIDKWNKK